jgi:chromosome segregation ATPase
MFKIIKWTTIGVVGLGATGFFLFGDNALNYVSTMASSVKDSVRGQIPIEFELKRAEKLIHNIGPQIHQCKLDLARQEVQMENLMDDVDHLERRVGRAEHKLKAGADMLATSNGQASYELAGGSYSRERVEIDLERTFETYKHNTQLMKSKKALIGRQNKAVAAARTKLDAVRAEEVRLKDLIGQLKTQKAQLDAMKASSKNFVLDDSALGQAKKVLSEVKERLDVAQKMLQDDLFFEDGIRGPRQPRRNIVKEINQHFSPGHFSPGHGAEALVEVHGEPAVIRR